MEEKYIVLKKLDVLKYVWDKGIDDLNTVCRIVNRGREQDGKKQNTYLVINTDETYAEEVIDVLKRNGHWG